MMLHGDENQPAHHGYPQSGQGIAGASHSAAMQQSKITNGLQMAIFRSLSSPSHPGAMQKEPPR
jgi:hypothetical protein